MTALIWQQVHLRSEGQAKLFSVSQALIRRLNPDADILTIDNNSPIDPRPYAQPDGLWFKFRDSIGHYFHDGKAARDGPGRGHSVAWSIAMAAGYDRAAYVEADCLLAKPAQWAFDQMVKPVAAEPGCKYYPEADWHAWFVRDLRWFKAFDFVGKYDWPSRVGEPGGEPPGELIYLRIFGDELQTLPLRGGRGDAIGLTLGNFHQLYPDGIDIVTHVDTDVYCEFLRVNGHEDMVAIF